jgi:hypothetical protein
LCNYPDGVLAFHAAEAQLLWEVRQALRVESQPSLNMARFGVLVWHDFTFLACLPPACYKYSYWLLANFLMMHLPLA